MFQFFFFEVYAHVKYHKFQICLKRLSSTVFTTVCACVCVCELHMFLQLNISFLYLRLKLYCIEWLFQMLYSFLFLYLHIKVISRIKNVCIITCMSKVRPITALRPILNGPRLSQNILYVNMFAL